VQRTQRGHELGNLALIKQAFLRNLYPNFLLGGIMGMQFASQLSKMLIGIHNLHRASASALASGLDSTALSTAVRDKGVSTSLHSLTVFNLLFEHASGRLPQTPSRSFAGLLSMAFSRASRRNGAGNAG
jgi:hypothetical protein